MHVPIPQPSPATSPLPTISTYQNPTQSSKPSPGGHLLHEAFPAYPNQSSAFSDLMFPGGTLTWHFTHTTAVLWLSVLSTLSLFILGEALSGQSQASFFSALQPPAHHFAHNQYSVLFADGQMDEQMNTRPQPWPPPSVPSLTSGS